MLGLNITLSMRLYVQECKYHRADYVQYINNGNFSIKMITEMHIIIIS